LVIASIVALLLMGGGILLLGIPGAIYMEMTVPVVELLLGAPQGSLFRGDAGWPTALMLTLAVPMPLPLLLWLGLRQFQGRTGPALLVTIAGLWIWAVLLLLALSTAL
jgi:hypothetical protein